MSVIQLISALTAEHPAASLCEVADDVSCRVCLGEVQQSRPYELDRALRQRQPELGLRLLLAIMYVARRDATEGQIWPSVRTGLNLSATVADLLFHGNGQPRHEVKALIETTCRRYRLRHVFGQDGTQEWFGSIYLQFGFTQRGFAKMLPEWLMGYNQPNTISRLLDDRELKSESFRKMWDALLSFRRGNATEVQCRRLISESPWVLPEWTDGLLIAAKKKPHLSPAIYQSGSNETGAVPRSFLAEPRLIVRSMLSDAQWQIELAGLAEWELKGDSYCVRLRCGESVQEIFLHKQADDSFSNLAHIFEFQLTHLKESHVNAAIMDKQGREVAAQDIHLFDPDADIMAFSERGRIDTSFVERGPRSNTLYVMIRSDLNLMPQPAEWHRFVRMGYKLHRLHLEVGQQLRVIFEDGDELWSSTNDDRRAESVLPGGITPKCELSPKDNARLYDPETSEIVVRVSGMRDTKILSAQWRSRQLSIEPPNLSSQLPWRIGKIPKIDFISASRILLKLRVQSGEAVYRTEIEWKPSLVGILERSRGRSAFGELFGTRNNEQLKRGRYMIMPKPLTFEQKERGLNWCLFEGDRFVSTIREGSPQSFYNLGAYGQSLSIGSGQFNREDKPTTLVGEVVDKGLFHIYDKNPFLGVDYTFEAWASPEMGAEHKLYFGLMHERPTCEPADQRLVFDCDKAMFGPFPPLPCDYLVLAYSGVRLASWWRVPKDGSCWSSNLAKIKDDVDARRAAFTIRWAKLPILSSHHYHQVKEFFRRFPHVVLAEWLCGCKERKDGRKIEGENAEAWHDAVRAIIQGYQIENAELTTETKLKLIYCLPKSQADDMNAKILDTFQAVGACDPVLMGRMIRWWSHTDASKGIVGTMKALLMQGSPVSADLMIELQSDVPGIDDGFLQSIINTGIGAVITPVLDDRSKHNLKSALTISSFRRLLIHRIIEQYLP